MLGFDPRTAQLNQTVKSISKPDNFLQTVFSKTLQRGKNRQEIRARACVGDLMQHSTDDISNFYAVSNVKYTDVRILKLCNDTLGKHWKEWYKSKKKADPDASTSLEIDPNIYASRDLLLSPKCISPIQPMDSASPPEKIRIPPHQNLEDIGDTFTNEGLSRSTGACGIVDAFTGISNIEKHLVAMERTSLYMMYLDFLQGNSEDTDKLPWDSVAFILFVIDFDFDFGSDSGEYIASVIELRRQQYRVLNQFLHQGKLFVQNNIGMCDG